MNSSLTPKELIYRVSLPALLLLHFSVVSPLMPGGPNLFEGWWRLIYLVPRVLLYFLLSP